MLLFADFIGPTSSLLLSSYLQFILPAGCLVEDNWRFSWILPNFPDAKEPFKLFSDQQDLNLHISLEPDHILHSGLTFALRPLFSLM